MLTPGSNESREKGCTCSAMMNNRGTGTVISGHEPLFFKNEYCPFHGVEAEMEAEFQKDNFHTNEMEEEEIISNIKEKNENR